MEGREYELLLEKVYGTRAESRGVDAEMYQQMLENYENIRTRQFFETQEERIYEFKRSFLVIREQVHAAVAEGAKKILRTADDNDLRTLEMMCSKLKSDFFDPQELQHIIRKANFVLSANGLVNRQATMIFTNSRPAYTGFAKYHN